MRYETPEQLPRMLSTHDVAEWLGKTPAYVRKHAELGVLPGVKVGKFWFFSEVRLARWLEEQAA